MAKKRDLTNPFARTEGKAAAPDLSDLDEGVIKSTGIGLRQGEIRAVDELAEGIGVSRNALLRWIVRWFLKEHRSGRVDPGDFVEEPPPPKKNLRLP
jgi:hypothetical protein